LTLRASPFLSMGWCLFSVARLGWVVFLPVGREPSGRMEDFVDHPPHYLLAHFSPPPAVLRGSMPSPETSSQFFAWSLLELTKLMQVMVTGGWVKIFYFPPSLFYKIICPVLQCYPNGRRFIPTSFLYDPMISQCCFECNFSTLGLSC